MLALTFTKTYRSISSQNKLLKLLEQCAVTVAQLLDAIQILIYMSLT